MRSDYRPGMLKDWVKRFCRLFVGSIFKWVQAPQAVHLGVLDLDRERALQLPVVQSPEWLSIDEIDFGNTELWNRPDWDGIYAKLRQERPVSWHTEPEIEGLGAPGPGFWSLTRYEHIQHASRHPEIFLSGKGTNIPDFPPEVYEFLGSMINMDDPAHRHRRALERALRSR